MMIKINLECPLPLGRKHTGVISCLFTVDALDEKKPGGMMMMIKPMIKMLIKSWIKIKMEKPPEFFMILEARLATRQRRTIKGHRFL